MATSHSILNAGNLLMVQERERLLGRIFRQQGFESLEGVRAFEAGCSAAYNLRFMVQWGGRVEDQAGIDLDPASVAYARSRTPGMRIHEGSAEAVPEPDELFDLAFAFTLFSSVRDEDVAERIALELFRVTRPGGLILLYDMRRRSPRNPSVHAIQEDDVRRWFPTCPMRAYSLTLAPPVARVVGRFAPFLYGPLSVIPLLRTHRLYVLRRPALALRRGLG